MTTPDLALRLHDAGLAWTPVDGDRFWLPDRDLDDAVFTVSAMVVEVREHPSGRVLAFNGTTEWALDDVEEGEAVWLPRLDQLLAVLGERFVSLTARSGGHVVRVRVGDVEEDHVDLDPSDAAARAVLARLEREPGANGHPSR
ncbi:pilus assembly protein CpaE [Nocardioides zeicaulis]|uniref:Pilus assembly protein CpaE n=1 Tax=Nocardioides zeicaulis TaxID=1776857 RepID=A0ABV6DYY8_9ACTN